MNEDRSNWIEHLSNKVALNSSFEGKAPSLDRLRLAQVVMGQTGDLHISLSFLELPAQSPKRWIANGNDCVQLRLSFYDLTKLTIIGVAHEGNLEVSASFGLENEFRISSSQFNIELTYGYVQADLYPFNSAVFEEPLEWYRR